MGLIDVIRIVAEGQTMTCKHETDSLHMSGGMVMCWYNVASR